MLIRILYGADTLLSAFEALKSQDAIQVEMRAVGHHPTWFVRRSLGRNLLHWLGQLAPEMKYVWSARYVVFGTHLARLLWPVLWWKRHVVWVFNELPDGRTPHLVATYDRLIMRSVGHLLVSSPRRAEWVKDNTGRRAVGVLPNVPVALGATSVPIASRRRQMVYSGLISHSRFPKRVLEVLERCGIGVDFFGFQVSPMPWERFERLRYRGQLSRDQLARQLPDYLFALLSYPTDDANNNLCAPIKVYEYVWLRLVSVSVNRNEGLIDWMNRYPQLFRHIDDIGMPIDEGEFERQRVAFLAAEKRQVEQAVVVLQQTLGLS